MDNFSIIGIDILKRSFHRNTGPTAPSARSVARSNVQANIKHRTATHRCRDCTSGTIKTFFALRTGTIMERTRLSYRHWAIAIYLFTTNLKGVSSMMLHRPELGITQKSARFMLHGLRKAAAATTEAFFGSVEVDEAY